jgi:hypothetical protein
MNQPPYKLEDGDLQASREQLWVSREGPDNRLTSVCPVKEHLKFSLSMGLPWRSDVVWIIRLDVRVERLHNRKEGFGKRCDELCDVERRTTAGYKQSALKRCEAISNWYVRSARELREVVDDVVSMISRWSRKFTLCNISVSEGFDLVLTDDTDLI